MTRLLTVTLAVTLIAGFVYSAPADNDCILVKLLQSRSETLNICVQKTINGTSNSTDSSNSDHILAGIYRFIKFNYLATYKGNLTDDEKTQSLLALFCYLKMTVKQNPILGVFAYDCSTNTTVDKTDHQFAVCFMDKIKSSCSTAKDIQKRSVDSSGEDVLLALLSRMKNVWSN
ncbi:hypothetical protein CHUAL_009076 [Chamberlinius hualienensis]